jgi:hypothetical protein
VTASSSSRFYWSDWRGDPKLRMCSLAARGLWIEMLAFMAESEPRGHLLINGLSPSLSTLSKLLNTHHKTLKALLNELESHGVFSRRDNGVIYSRRMVRDEEKAAERRRCGALGGNPDLKVKDKLQDKVEDNLDLKSARASFSFSRKKKERRRGRRRAQKRCASRRRLRLRRADHQAQRARPRTMAEQLLNDPGHRGGAPGDRRQAGGQPAQEWAVVRPGG